MKRSARQPSQWVEQKKIEWEYPYQRGKRKGMGFGREWMTGKVREEM